MKIAFIVTDFPTLSETFILNQITGLIARGHEVDVYADYQRKESEVHSDIKKYNLLNYTYYRPQMPSNIFLRVLKGVKLLLTNFWKNPLIVMRSLNGFKYGKYATSLTLLYTVIPLLQKQTSYDIIHCHFGWNGLKGLFLREIGVIQGKLVTTFHGSDMTKYLKNTNERIYERLFDIGDLFLPISELWQRKLIELGCNGKIIVHRMGIDCRKFSFTSCELQHNKPLKIVTIARLVEKKGVEYGIRAIEKLTSKLKIEYSVIGDGPLRQDLQQLIQDLDVGDTVKLLGWKQQQEIIEILNNSDILLAPSVTARNGDQEGIPVVLMEAMAMGLPIISTEHSGIPELVKNGVSGFLVPERDVNTLTEKLGYLLEHLEVLPNMGKTGRVYVEEYFDINKLNDQLVKIYQQLLT